MSTKNETTTPSAAADKTAHITSATFEGQEIPFNLHGPIRELLAQRDKLLAAAKAVRACEDEGLTEETDYGFHRIESAWSDLRAAIVEAEEGPERDEQERGEAPWTAD